MQNSDMEEQDDEELVLAQSPLDNYLREVGVMHIPTYSSTTTANIDAVNSQSKHKPEVLHGNIFVQLIKDVLLSFILWIMDLMQVPCRLGFKLRNNILRKQSCLLADALLTCKLFELDDETVFFKKYFEDDLDNGHENRKKVFLLEKLFPFLGLFMAVVAFLGASHWSLPTHLYPSFTSVLCWKSLELLLGFLVLLSPFLFLTTLTLHDYYTLRSLSNMVEEGLQVLHSFNCTLDNSILIIREVEVVSLGFLYPRGHISKIGSHSSEIEKRESYCEPLRKSVQKATSEISKEFAVLGDKIRQLDQIYSSLTTTHPFETASRARLETLITFLDGGEDQRALSLNSLKTNVGIFRYITLEVIKLCIIAVTSYREILDCQHPLKSLFSSKTFSKAFRGTVSAMVNSLQHRAALCLKVYSFTKRYPFGYVREKEGGPRRLVNNEAIHMHQVLRGIELHSQALLTEVKRMVTMLKNRSVEDVVELKIAAESGLTACGRSSAAVAVCLDDLKDIIGRLSKPNDVISTKEKDGNFQDVTDTQEQASKSSQSNEPYTSPKDETPEGDKLFEGISDPQELCNERLSRDDPLSLDSKEQVRANRRLVTELRSIFSYKESPVGLVSFDQIKKMKDSELFVHGEPLDECSGDSHFPYSVRDLKKCAREFVNNAGSPEDQNTNVYIAEEATCKEDKPVTCSENPVHSAQPLTNSDLSFLTFQEAFKQSILQKSKVMGMQVDTFGESDSDDVDHDVEEDR